MGSISGNFFAQYPPFTTVTGWKNSEHPWCYEERMEYKNHSHCTIDAHTANRMFRGLHTIVNHFVFITRMSTEKRAYKDGAEFVDLSHSWISSRSIFNTFELLYWLRISNLLESIIWQWTAPKADTSIMLRRNTNKMKGIITPQLYWASGIIVFDDSSQQQERIGQLYHSSSVTLVMALFGHSFHRLLGQLGTLCGT